VAVGLTLAISSLPMFYSLEPSPDLPHHSVWGHVDAFLASIAALATAGFIASLRTHSLAWLGLGAAAAAFSIFVKPAGMTVMALTGLAWFALSAARLVRARDGGEDRRCLLRHIGMGLALILPLYAAVVALSIASGYLTLEEIGFFRRGLSVLSSLRTSPWTWREVHDILNAAVGYPFAALGLVGLGGAIAFAYREYGRRALLRDPAVIGTFCAVVFVVLGIAWWIVTTSGAMVRYIYPILLMFCVAMLPGIGLTALRSGRVLRIAVLCVSFASAANLAALLVAPAPSLSWQRMSGVNLSAGRSNDAAAAARTFLASLAPGSRPPTIYMFGAQASITTFESVVNFATLTDPATPRVQFLRPVDWVRSATYRLNEVLGADYLLVPLLRGYSPASSNDSYYLEDLAMRAFASSLTTADGVRVEISTPDLSLLKVVDRSALHRSLLAFVRKYGWSRDFTEANSSLWSDSGMLATEKEKSRLLMDRNVFGNVLEVLAVTSRREGSGQATVIDVWWKPTDEHAIGDADLAFEFRSASGDVLMAGEVPLPMRSAPDIAKPIRHDAAFFRLAIPANARFLVVSVKRDGAALPAVEGATDADPTHAIVSLSEDGAARFRAPRQ
jgi:hypothetical protein